MPKRFRYPAVILMLFGCFSVGFSQDTVSGKVTGEGYAYGLTDIPHDFVKVVVSPFHWTCDDWMVAGVWLGAAAVSLPADREIDNFFLRNGSATGRNISKYAIEPWGSGVYMLPALTLAYASGLINNNSRLRYASFKSAEAWLFTAAAVQAGKFTFHRHRPYESPDEPFRFDGPALSPDYTSMPSGHTGTAFAVATVWARVYSDKPWVGVAAYSAAALVGISRLYDRKHWLSDVVAGAVVGYWMGSTLVPRNGKQRRALSVVPVLGTDGCQVSVLWRPGRNGKGSRRERSRLP